MIDLHFHSTCSDGTLTPVELAEAGSKLGLTAMVLTDHDSSAGCAEFIRAAGDRGIRSTTGMELSVEGPGQGIHLLAYGFDPQNADLMSALVKIKRGRAVRNNEIFAKLVKCGCVITANDVLKFAGDKTLVGRPHFALALIEKGYASSKADAFERYLGRTGVAYADRFRLTPPQAIQLIHAAGGAVSLAHPMQYGFGYAKLCSFVGSLADMGLDGIESFYVNHSSEMIAECLELAEKFGLIVTGGSDFHGGTAPDVRFETSAEKLHVPDSVFGELCGRIRQRQTERAHKITEIV